MSLLVLGVHFQIRAHVREGHTLSIASNCNDIIKSKYKFEGRFHYPFLIDPYDKQPHTIVLGNSKDKLIKETGYFSILNYI